MKGRIALAHVSQLVDEVDEEKQRQKSQSHEGHRRHDVGIQQAAHCLHAAALRAPCGRGHSVKLVPLSRHQSRLKASTRALPCVMTSAKPMLILPLDTQACERLIRL